jgi:hypothetical protein
VGAHCYLPPHSIVGRGVRARRGGAGVGREGSDGDWAAVEVGEPAELGSPITLCDAVGCRLFNAWEQKTRAVEVGEPVAGAGAGPAVCVGADGVAVAGAEEEGDVVVVPLGLLLVGAEAELGQAGQHTPHGICFVGSIIKSFMCCAVEEPIEPTAFANVVPKRVCCGNGRSVVQAALPSKGCRLDDGIWVTSDGPHSCSGLVVSIT